VFDALRAEPGFRVVAAPRGRDPERALEVDLKFQVPPARN
jgi:hypothetical protein